MTTPAADQVEITITEVNAAAARSMLPIEAPVVKTGTISRTLLAVVLVLLAAGAAAPWTAEHLYVPLWQTLVATGPEVPEQTGAIFFAVLVNALILGVGVLVPVSAFSDCDPCALQKRIADGDLAGFYEHEYAWALRRLVWPNDFLCTDELPTVSVTVADWHSYRAQADRAAKTALAGRIRDWAGSEQSDLLSSVGLGTVVVAALYVLFGQFAAPVWLPASILSISAIGYLALLFKLYEVERQVGRKFQADYRIGFRFIPCLILLGLIVLLKLVSYRVGQEVLPSAAVASEQYQAKIAKDCSKAALVGAPSGRRDACAALTAPGFATELADAMAGRRSLSDSGTIQVERVLRFSGAELKVLRRIEVITPSYVLDANFWVPL